MLKAYLIYDVKYANKKATASGTWDIFSVFSLLSVKVCFQTSCPWQSSQKQREKSNINQSKLRPKYKSEILYIYICIYTHIYIYTHTHTIYANIYTYLYYLLPHKIALYMQMTWRDTRIKVDFQIQDIKKGH